MTKSTSQSGNVAGKMMGNNRPLKWDWEKIEKLVLSGKTNREILAMPEFEGMPYAYLKNRAAKFGLHKKKEEVLALAAGQVEKTLVERRTEGIENHHLFTFEQLDKMRKAILEHRVTGKVQDLRAMMTLFQQYIDAAEKSYGLNGKDINSQAVSLNAMVSLHLYPPQRDESGKRDSNIAEGDFEKIEATDEGGEGLDSAPAEG